MVYDIPADPEWDLQALLAKVSDLCKEAVAGGIFLGDIGDLADQHDVTSAVAELQNQRFSVLRSLSRTLGATQEDRRADYGAEDRIKTGLAQFELAQDDRVQRPSKLWLSQFNSI